MITSDFYQNKTFISKKINPLTLEIGDWLCKWENIEGHELTKVYLNKTLLENNDSLLDIVIWNESKTIFNTSHNLISLGLFSKSLEKKAIIPCQIISCAKFRNGAKRFYCKTHQCHCGTKADIEKALKDKNNDFSCKDKNLEMNYSLFPKKIKIKTSDSLDLSLENDLIKINLNEINLKANAFIIFYEIDQKIKEFQLTSLVVDSFLSIKEKSDVSSVSCKKCGKVHIDLNSFANHKHKKHYCANCGNDSLFSEKEIISNPLVELKNNLLNFNIF